MGQKSELQKALEKHKRTQIQKEIEQQKNSCRTQFERMIEDRAKKIETVFINVFMRIIIIIMCAKNIIAQNTIKKFFFFENSLRIFSSYNQPKLPVQ